MILKTHFAQKIRPVELASLIKLLTGNKRKVLNHGLFKFYLDTWSDLYWSLFDRHLNQTLYEAAWTVFIVNYLQPGYTFIDLGANEGWYSIHAAKQVGHEGRVFSIEPQKRLKKVIQKNAELNHCDNISIWETAIGNDTGIFNMTITPSLNTGSSTFVKLGRSILWPKQKTMVNKLDHLLLENHISHVNLLKIDVEGYEYSALKSMEIALTNKKIDTILIDFHKLQLAALNISEAEIKNYLFRFGFQQKKIGEVVYFTILN